MSGISALINIGLSFHKRSPPGANLAGFCVEERKEWLGRMMASSDARQPGQLCQSLVAHGHLLQPVARPFQQGRAFVIPVSSAAQVAVIPAP